MTTRRPGPGKAVQALLDEIADPEGRNAPASARAANLLLSKVSTSRCLVSLPSTSTRYLARRRGNREAGSV